MVRKFPFCDLLSKLGTRGRNRFDRRLFFRKQAERLTVSVVGRKATRPRAAQEVDAMAVVVQDGNHGRRSLSHSAASRMPSGDSETAAGSRLRKSVEIFGKFSHPSP